MGLFKKIAKKVGVIATLPLRIFAEKTAEVIPTTPERALKLTGRVAVGALPALRAVPAAAPVISKIVAAAVKKPVATAVKVLTGVVAAKILVKSPKAREFVGALPEKVGVKTEEAATYIAERIEEPEKETTIGTGLKVAGVAGAVAAAAVIIPKIIKKKEEIPTLTPLPSERQQEAAITTQTPILPETEVITEKEAAPEPREAMQIPSVRQSVKVSIINKPKATGISIRNKRYLNQINYI